MGAPVPGRRRPKTPPSGRIGACRFGARGPPVIAVRLRTRPWFCAQPLRQRYDRIVFRKRRSKEAVRGPRPGWMGDHPAQVISLPAAASRSDGRRPRPSAAASPAETRPGNGCGRGGDRRPRSRVGRRRRHPRGHGRGRRARRRRRCPTRARGRDRRPRGGGRRSARAALLRSAGTAPARLSCGRTGRAISSSRSRRPRSTALPRVSWVSGPPSVVVAASARSCR